MQFTKKLRICEVSVLKNRTDHFRIVFEDNKLRLDEESFIVLNPEAHARYDIPRSQNILGKYIVFDFTTKNMDTITKGPRSGFIDMTSIQRGDLRILSIEADEVTVPYFEVLPQTKVVSKSRVIKVSSFDIGDGAHLNSIVFPFFSLTLELTDKEYDECKNLPILTCLSTKIHLEHPDE